MKRSCPLRYLILVVVACAGLGLCISPCLAGYGYYSGGPDLSISLDSSNQFVPGTTVQVPLVVENRGTLSREFYSAYVMQTQYLPTTALFTTVQLLPGNTPVSVKSNSQIVGEVQSGSVVPTEFTVEIPQDAKAGNYTMQAVVTYQYVPWVQQEALYQIEYTFKDGTTTIPVPVQIRPVVVLSVENISGTRLSAGGEGYVLFTLRNTGQDTGRLTSVFLVPQGSSPVVPASNGVFIGTFPPGATAEPRFKVAISRDAGPAQPSPVSLYAVYQDFEGNTITSPSVSTSVTFGRKTEFECTSPPAVVHPGKTETVSVTYKNIGTSPVYNARARISVIDPFSSDDDTAYLGNLRPGESATAIFTVKTTAGTTLKTYTIDSEVGYNDLSRTGYTSDNIPVILEVQEDPTPWLSGIIVIIVIMGAGYYAWIRKKSQEM